MAGEVDWDNINRPKYCLEELVGKKRLMVGWYFYDGVNRIGEGGKEFRAMNIVWGNTKEGGPNNSLETTPYSVRPGYKGNPGSTRRQEGRHHTKKI